MNQTKETLESILSRDKDRMIRTHNEVRNQELKDTLTSAIEIAQKIDEAIKSKDLFVINECITNLQIMQKRLWMPEIHSSIEMLKRIRNDILTSNR